MTPAWTRAHEALAERLKKKVHQEKANGGIISPLASPALLFREPLLQSLMGSSPARHALEISGIKK
eukprot:4256491-Karenia_brevis.AAC.1